MTWEILFCCVADESGCEADMAEGGQDEDSGGVMLATVTTPTTASSGAAVKRDPDAPLTLKSEVSLCVESLINLLTPGLNPSAQRCLTRFYWGFCLLNSAFR
jgi:hypothetical protein